MPAILFAFLIAERTTAVIRRSETEGQFVLSLVSRENVNQINSSKSLLNWLANKSSREDSLQLFKDKKYLAGLLAGYPQLVNIAFVAPNGDVLSRGYVIGPIVKKPMMHLARQHRRLQGVVFIALDLEYMNRLFRQVELPDGYHVYFVDRNRNVLSGTSKNGINVIRLMSEVDEATAKLRVWRSLLAAAAAKGDGKSVGHFLEADCPVGACHPSIGRGFMAKHLPVSAFQHDRTSGEEFSRKKPPTSRQPAVRMSAYGRQNMDSMWQCLFYRCLCRIAAFWPWCLCQRESIAYLNACCLLT